MKKIYYIVIVLLLVGAGVLFFANHSKAPSTAPDENANVAVDATSTVQASMVQPWVEVLKSTVQVQNGENWENLQTGDELGDGMVIKTDEAGLAEIHMPDGSAIRLDSSSQIVLDIAQYDENSDTLKVKIKLSAGRVWSKIVELVTTESYWEVQTTNAVAAVRGTSFGMEYAGDETQIIGSENTVEVSAFDPETGESLGQAPVTERKFLTIKRDVLKNLRDKRALLSAEVKDVGADFEGRPWIKRAFNSDQLLNRRIEELKAQGMDRAEIRRTLRRELSERRRQILINLRNAGIEPRRVRLLDKLPAIAPAVSQPAGTSAPTDNGQTVSAPPAANSDTSTTTPDLVTQNWMEVEKTMSSTDIATGTANLGQYFLNQNNLAAPAN